MKKLILLIVFSFVIIFISNSFAQTQNVNCSCKGKLNPKATIKFTNSEGAYVSKKFKCSGETSEPEIFIRSGTSIIYVASEYSCASNQCAVTYSWKIDGPKSHKEGSYHSFPIAFPAPTEMGNCTFVIYAICDGRKCDSCTFSFITTDCLCEPPKATIRFNKLGETSSNEVECYARYSLEKGASYIFTSSTIFCTTNLPSCLPVYEWQVNGEYSYGQTFKYVANKNQDTIVLVTRCGENTCSYCPIIIVTE